jgi:pheromone shutdown protein TraB
MHDKLNSEMIHHLNHDGKRIILVGTAHVSKESVDLVEAIIADVKPDTVCVELCEAVPSPFARRTAGRRWISSR